MVYTQSVFEKGRTGAVGGSLAVTAPVGVLGYLVFLLMDKELVPFAKVISTV